MTLLTFLIDKQAEHTAKALKNFSADKVFYEHTAKAKCISDILGELSDETLKTKIITRVEAITKGVKETQDV